MQGVYCKIDEATMDNFRNLVARTDAKVSMSDKDWAKAKEIAKKIINVKKDVFYHVPAKWILDYNVLVWDNLKLPITNLFCDGRSSIMPNGKKREKISGQSMVNDLVKCPEYRAGNVTWYEFDTPKATTLVVRRGFNEKMENSGLILLADKVYQKMEPGFKDIGLEIAGFVVVTALDVWGSQAKYGALCPMPDENNIRHTNGAGHAIGNVICRDMKTGKIVPMADKGVYESSYEGRMDVYEKYAMRSFLNLLNNYQSAGEALLGQYSKKVK